MVLDVVRCFVVRRRRRAFAIFLSGEVSSTTLVDLL